MEKYYTPELEEFYVGFEIRIQDIDTAQFYTKIFEDGESAQGILDWDLGEPTVKHLDREDIESFGWVHDPKLPFHKPEGDNRICFNKEKGRYILILNGYKVLIYKDTGSSHEGLFRGKIKNKSELKKILKQIGYEG